MSRLLAWFSLLLFAASHSLAAERPNIVLIFADDLGYGDVRCFSPESKIATPNLDRLAQQGIRCTDAHTADAVCTPSRYALLTGRYAWRTPLKSGVLGGFSRPLLKPDRLTVASLLKKQGYRTACIGKWHLGLGWGSTKERGLVWKGSNNATGIDFTKPIKDTPLDHGFDRYFGIAASLDMPPYCFIADNRVTKQPTDKNNQGGRPGPMAPGWRHEDVLPTLADRAIEFIGQEGEQPFFLYMPLNAPHTPVVPNQEFLGKSGLDRYGDFVVEVDHHVGRVLKALDDKGIAEETLVIVTSDNGPEVNMFPRRAKLGHDSSSHYLGAKRDNWEGGHRVPFLARWPGKIPAGSTWGHPIGLVDLMATVADIVDEELPDNAGEDSVSMLSALTNPKSTSARTERGLIHHSANGSFAIRQGRWKLLLHAGSGGNGYRAKRYAMTPEQAAQNRSGKRQLYDLAADPDETHNLAEEHPEVVERLTQLAANYVRHGRSTPGEQQPYVQEKWPQLNWLPDEQE